MPIKIENSAGSGAASTSLGLSQFSATTSAELAGIITNESGSGVLVLANSPTLITPILGAATATSVNKNIFTAPATSSTWTLVDGKTLTCSNTLTFSGTDGSALDIGAGGVLGTGAYATIANYALLNSPSFTTPTLGVAVATSINKNIFTTPVSSCTWTLINGKTFTVNNTIALSGTDSSTLDIGSGGTLNTGAYAIIANYALLNSPSFTTPTLGVASATSLNKVTITAPATSATLTVANGKTLTASNTLTFTGTDSSSIACGGGGTVAYVANKLSAFAATTSAELAGVISDETGSGALVFATSPALVTPALGVATATSVNFGQDPLNYYDEGTWTPVPASLTVVGTPTYTGTFTRIGRQVFCTMSVTSTVTTAATNPSTTFTGLPFTQSAVPSACIATNTSAANLGVGAVSANVIYPPSWGAVNGVFIVFTYLV